MATAKLRDVFLMTVENQPILTLQSVRKSYRGRAALQGISLQLYPGELLGFFGPNGAGKTTMIRCICGLLKQIGRAHV